MTTLSKFCGDFINQNDLIAMSLKVITDQFDSWAVAAAIIR